MPPKFNTRYVERGDLSTARESERTALLDGEDSDEDFFLRGPNAQPRKLLQNDGKIERLHGQVSEVIDVMQDNINKVMDRGEKLDDLQDKSESLSSNADMFRVRAKSLKTTFWWKECKMKILMAVIIIIIILIIVVPIIIKYHK